MFVYAVCESASGQLDATLRPSLKRYGLGPLIVRFNATSIYDGYNSLMEEAIERWPQLEGVVLVHDDVEIRDPQFETALRDAFSEPRVGVVGAIGGRGHVEMSWWKTTDRYGRVGSLSGPECYAEGPAVVDTVDGLLMAVSPRFARQCRLEGRGYPGFHGYDSELCAVARAAGMTVLVGRLSVFHHNKPPALESPELNWAMFEWMLRWRPASPRLRALWRAKRFVLRWLAMRGVRRAPRFPWTR